MDNYLIINKMKEQLKYLWYGIQFIGFLVLLIPINIIVYFVDIFDGVKQRIEEMKK